MKKFIVLLLVSLLALPHGICLAQESDFSFEPETGIITKYTGDASEVVVPAVLQGVPVRAIGQGVFDQNSALTRVTLPEGLTHIMQSAFYFCENLREINLPSSLEAIDPYAFFNCSALTSLNFPASLSFVGGKAFAFCGNLSTLAFLGECPLIREEAFASGPEGRQITVPHEEQAAYEKALGQPCLPGGNCVYLDHQVAENLLTFDAQTGAITACQSTAAYLALPDTVGGVPVQSIADRAFFANPWLRRIQLPQGLNALGQGVFLATRLAEVKLPDNLQTIGKETFKGVPLQTLSFPAGLVSLGEGAFKGCDQLDFLTFAGQTPPEIGPEAFKDCGKIADIDIATDATKAQARAFEEAFVAAGLSAGSFTVWRADPPDLPPYDFSALTQFDDATGLITSFETQQSEVAMFWNHWNKEQTATLDIRGIADSLFENSAITAFFVPHSEKFEHIGKRAFAGSALEKIHLFDSVKTIDDGAFADCKQLTAITLPAGVKLGQGVFSGCDALAQLILPADVVLTGELGLPPDRIRVSADASEEQRTALGRVLGFPWHQPLLREGEASAFLTMPDSFAPDPETDFEFDPATGTITKYLGTSPVVVIPRAIGGVTVKEIGFLSFSNLTLYTVAQGTASNTSLNQVIIPETVTQIADSAFLNCQALTRVECYGPVDRVGNRAFEDCAALEEIIFHNGVKSLDLYAFHLCKSLRRAELGQAIEALPEGAFAGCGFTGELVLSIPDIGKLAYKDNAQVTSLHILPSVREIGEGAFLGIPGLKEVYFEGGDPHVLGEYRYQFDESATELKICLPESASDEALAAFITKMKQNGLPGEDMVIRKNCPTGH